MLSHIVHLIAKIDPFKYLLSKAALTKHLAKWMIIFSKFDIQHVERKAIKGKAIANKLIDFELQDKTPMQIEFPIASIMYIIERTRNMFFDGSHT